MKNSILLTLTTAALGTIFFTVSGARERSTISGPARVVDGDTVVVACTTVRLKGVDAAELGTARGENARRVMLELVTGTLTCRLTGEKTWGREVGYCTTTDGVDVNNADGAIAFALLRDEGRPIKDLPAALGRPQRLT